MNEKTEWIVPALVGLSERIANIEAYLGALLAAQATIIAEIKSESRDQWLKELHDLAEKNADARRKEVLQSVHNVIAKHGGSL